MHTSLECTQWPRYSSKSPCLVSRETQSSGELGLSLCGVLAVFDIRFGFDKACTAGEGFECNRSIFGEQACRIESSYAEYWINSLVFHNCELEPSPQGSAHRLPVFISTSNS